MQKIVLSSFIIIIVLIITGCTSSSGNRGNAGQYGSWAKNSTAFSNPSILQCAWWKGIQYKTRNVIKVLGHNIVNIDRKTKSL